MKVTTRLDISDGVPLTSLEYGQCFRFVGGSDIYMKVNPNSTTHLVGGFPYIRLADGKLFTNVAQNAIPITVEAVER